jgi:hypothetical protein
MKFMPDSFKSRFRQYAQLPESARRFPEGSEHILFLHFSSNAYRIFRLCTDSMISRILSPDGAGASLFGKGKHIFRLSRKKETVIYDQCALTEAAGRGE